MDALRGYMMVITLSQVPLVRSLRPLTGHSVSDFVSHQLSHSTWHGASYVDIGFPGYLTAMGVTIALALERRKREARHHGQLYLRIFSRTIALFVIGILYNGGFQQAWPDVRIAGVIQRIAIGYCVSAILFLHLSGRQLAGVIVAILATYWAMLAWWSFPGYEAGDYSFEGNLAAAIDRMFLPGQALFGDWDPEGMVTTLPAIVSCLIGVLIGKLLFSDRLTAQEKVLYLLAAGSSMVTIGLLLSQGIPLNKAMWTPSFTVYSAGFGVMHVAVFYQIVDIWKSRFLFPFIVVGVNSLLAFLISRFLPLQEISAIILGGVGRTTGEFGPLILAIGEVAIAWLFLYAMYRNHLIMKI